MFQPTLPTSVAVFLLGTAPLYAASPEMQALCVGLGGIAVLTVLSVLLWSTQRVTEDRTERNPCRLDCTLTAEKTPQPAIVTDLSMLGARIDGALGLRRKSRVTLRVGDVERTAFVAWTGNSATGLAFRRPLSRARLRMVLATQQPG